MNQADVLDKAQFLVSNWYYIVLAVVLPIIGYFRFPQVVELAKAGLSKIKIPSLPSPGKKEVKEVDTAKADVLSLIDQMVDALPSITDETLHKQAVEASVSFAESVIRQAGLVQVEK